MLIDHKTVAEWEQHLGDQIRTARLRENISQIDLAESAGVGLTALKNIESGKGATLKTLIKVIRALERTDWLISLSPQVSISPMQLLRFKRPRMRASSPRTKRE